MRIDKEERSEPRNQRHDAWIDEKMRISGVDKWQECRKNDDDAFAK